MNSLVSIITPSYNSSKFVSQTIRSIISQTYQNWELLIIDDCSKDNSVEIIKKFADNDERIFLLQNKTNSGAAISRNRGIEKSTGKYIAFLDSDDIWEKDKLYVQMSIMIRDDLALSHTSYYLMNFKGVFLKNISVKELSSYNDLLKCNYIFCSTVMINVDKFKNIKMPNIRRRQDWALWLTLLKNTNYKAVGINKALCGYRITNDSLSSNKFKLIKYNYFIYRKVMKFNFFKTVFYFFRFFIYHFRKKTQNLLHINP